MHAAGDENSLLAGRWEEEQVGSGCVTCLMLNVSTYSYPEAVCLTVEQSPAQAFMTQRRIYCYGKVGRWIPICKVVREHWYEYPSSGAWRVR